MTEIKKTVSEYKTILKTAMDGFYLVDSQGRILDANDSYCSMTGYSLEELLQMSLKDIEAKETEEMIAKRIHRVLTEGHDRFETRHKCKDGRIIDIEASVNYDPADGGKFYSFMRDITDRKKFDQTLKENEEHLRSITESANDAIITIDSKGMIIFWNNGAINKFGYDKKEVIGKPLTILIPEKYRDAHLKGLDRFIATGKSHVIGNKVELSGLRKNGIEFPLELSLSTWKAGETVYFSGILRDITERKQRQEILEARTRLVEFSLSHSVDELLQKTLDEIEVLTRSQIGFFYFLDKDQRTITFQKWSTNALVEMCKTKGKGQEYDISEAGVWAECFYQQCPVIHNNYQELPHRKGLPPGHVPVIRELVIPIIRDNLIMAILGVGNKSVVYDKADVENTRLLGDLGWDLVERKRAEEKLLDSEEKYRMLYEGSSDAIMLLDEKGFFDCNDATLKIFGFYNKEDFTKIHPSQVSPPNQPDGEDSGTAANKRITEAFTKGSNHFEWVHRRQNGEDFPAEVLLSAFNFKGKQVLQATVRDIAERKIAHDLHIKNIRLETENKAKSEFLASMSHELRTPLNAIIGFSDIMTMGIGGSLNETQKGYVKDIHSAGDHLLLIINDILDISKVESGKMELLIERFSVDELMGETHSLVKYKAMQHNIDVIKNIDPQLGSIEGDKQRIKQVLFNLLSNAVKFSKEEGGKITVKVKKIGEMAEFSVSDTGIGIKKENLEKLFNEFQQLDTGITRKYGGTGLGLVISKKLVELHGGDIRVESVIGEGSTFTFTIPVKQVVKG
ncbi:MAG: PAS domain S-box protein [Candidatus Methanoperedens sp.]|nr:PAS domain S-box protein [Candidatus Methanoperedens sp.]